MLFDSISFLSSKSTIDLEPSEEARLPRNFFCGNYTEIRVFIGRQTE